MKLDITHLRLSWSISRGNETYGYNICRLDDTKAGRRFKCMGGGYDMVGTCFGDWLENTHQEKLLALVKELMTDSGKFEDCGYSVYGYIKFNGLYGMTYNTNSGKVTLDGACGIDAMHTIAKALGFEVETEWDRRPRSRGNTLGFFVSCEVQS